MKLACLLFFVLALNAEIVAPSQFIVDEIYPSEKVTFAHKEKSYVRIQYNSLRPIRFLIKAYFKGKEIESTFRLSPQPLYPEGRGEAVAWIGFVGDMHVDRISVQSLDGKWNVLESKELAVDWTWSEKLLKLKQKNVKPWVGRLSGVQQQMMREQLNQKGLRDNFFESVVMDILYFTFALYLLAQYYAFNQAKGSWRKKTLVPLFLFAPAIVYAVIGYMNQSSLWVLILLLAAAISLIYLTFLFFWFKISTRNR